MTDKTESTELLAFKWRNDAYKITLRISLCEMGIVIEKTKDRNTGGQVNLLHEVAQLR